MVCIHCGRDTESLVDDEEGGTVPVCDECLAQGLPKSTADRSERARDAPAVPDDRGGWPQSASGEVITCPKCRVPIGELDDAGQLDAVCARCRYRYYALRGTLAAAPARQVPNRFYPRIKRVEHALAIQTAHGTVLLPHNPYSRSMAAWLGPRMPQPVTVVQTVRRDKFEELVTVRTRTLNFMVAGPGRRSMVRALLWAFLAFSGIALFALSAARPAAGVAIAVLLGCGTFWFVAITTDPRERLTAAQIGQLARTQELLGKKASLTAQRDSSVHSLADIGTRAQTLASLAAKMRVVDEEAYSPRIETLDRAQRLLFQQASVHNRLVGVYDKAIAMVEIEMESSRLEEFGPDSLASLEFEVGDLRRQASELERQMTASAEVEKLLHDPELGV